MCCSVIHQLEKQIMLGSRLPLQVIHPSPHSPYTSAPLSPPPHWPSPSPRMSYFTASPFPGRSDGCRTALPLQSASFSLLNDDSLNFLEGVPHKARVTMRKHVIDAVMVRACHGAVPLS